MPTDKAALEAVPRGQHIFHADKIEPLAKLWQQLNVTDKDRATEVLEQIINLSTPMFERFAQFEEFDTTVPLPQLVAAAQEKVVGWLLQWDPNKGRLFSWFTKCAKNAFRGEISRVRVFRERFYTTDQSLEPFFKSEDHAVDQHDSAADVQQRIEGITSRWGSAQELGTIRYILECMADGSHSKDMVIRGASFTWGLSSDMVRFFYTWCMVALRNAMLDKISVPVTEQDVFRFNFSYTLLPDWLNLVPWEKAEHVCPKCRTRMTCSSASLKEIFAVFGGTRQKFPTLAELAEAHESFRIANEICASDMDPDSVGAVMEKHGRQKRTAEQIFKDMTRYDQHIAGEFSVYDDPQGQQL